MSSSLNRKVPQSLSVCLILELCQNASPCSFLFFLFTFMSSLCLHSLFKSPSAASNPSVCLSSRFWPSFISPFNLNSASSSCIHRDPLRGWSHLQPLIYNNLTSSLLLCLEPRPHTSKHRELKWDANTSLPPALFLWEWNRSSIQRIFWKYLICMKAL